MARIHTVKAFRGQRTCQHKDEGKRDTCGKARADHYRLDHDFTQAPLRCGAGCGNDIEIGQSYRHVTLKTGPYSSLRKTRHTTCSPFRQSDLTSSPHLSAAYLAIEGCEDALAAMDTPDSEEGVENAISELEGIRESMAEEMRQVAEGYRESGEAIEEGFGHPTYQSEELVEKADAFDSWADDIDGVQFFEPDPAQYQGDEDGPEEWLEEQAAFLLEATYDFPG